jgi:ferredoxin--NADP+ reductase
MAEKTVCHFKVEAPRIARKAKPGQFVVLKVNETGERIPLTMGGTDPATGLIDLIYGLAKNKILDIDARFSSSMQDKRVIRGENGIEYIVAFPEETGDGGCLEVIE